MIISIFHRGLEVLTGLSARQLAFRFPKAVVTGGNKQILGVTDSSKSVSLLTCYLVGMW